MKNCYYYYFYLILLISLRDLFDEMFDFLLFTYSPENNEKLVTLNAQFLKDEDLRIFILKTANKVKIKIYCALGSKKRKEKLNHYVF